MERYSYHYFGSTASPSSSSVSLEYKIHITKSGGGISVDLPFPSKVNLYYRKAQDGILVSTDLRSLHQKGDTLDPAGIVSLLVLGAVVPPLTPFKEIRALTPGYKHSIDLQTLALTSELSCSWSPPVQGDANCDFEAQAGVFTPILDATLRKLCPSEDPIILFSGGVDSSLLASRVVSMGWQQASYLHCSFGEQDPETVIAKDIARQLGITLDIASWDIDRGFETLTKAAALYPMPFCDLSCVPTHSLSCALASIYKGSRVVLDGTGADSCFGEFGIPHRISIVYRIPAPMRSACAALYGPLHLCESGSVIEYYGRLIRRSTMLPELTFTFAQNPLPGIGFTVDPNDLRTVNSLCDHWISSVAQSDDPEKLLPLLDVGLGCAGLVIEKNRQPLLDSSYIPEYPFTEHEVIDVALSRARYWPDNDSKKLLKYMLAKQVTKEHVYRKKSGLVAPPLTLFSHPTILGYLEAVCAPGTPLSEMVNHALVKKLLRALAAKKILATQTYNFIWAIAFCNAWLTQLAQIPPALKGEF